MIRLMPLAIADRTVASQTCPNCGEVYDLAQGFVTDEATIHAAYSAMCHGHPAHTAWIDVVVGRIMESEGDSNRTFACELRADGAMAIDAPQTRPAPPASWGRQLSRSEALADESVSLFWAVVDAISEQDESVRRHVYGLSAVPRGSGSLLSRVLSRLRPSG